MNTKKFTTNLLSLMAILVMACLSSCGHDNDPDNPNKTDDNIFSLEEYSVPAKYFPGDWTVESIVDAETGKKITPNIPFTILPFNVKKTSNELDKYVGDQIWTESYHPFVRVISLSGIKEEHGIVGFYRPDRASFTNSNIYELLLKIPDALDENKTHILTIAKLKYSNGNLEGFGSYGALCSNNYNPDSNVLQCNITLRKK